MMLKKTALLVAVLAASTALQPMHKAAARGEGAAILFGAIAGVAAAAAEDNAAQQQAAMLAAAAAQQQAAMMAAANAAVRQQACLQWLPVIYDQRYDPAMRTQAIQIVTSCGIPVPYVASNLGAAWGSTPFLNQPPTVSESSATMDALRRGR